jgi:hypothetical protein
VRDCDDQDPGVVEAIHNTEGERPQDEATRSEIVRHESVRLFGNARNRRVELVDKRERRSWIPNRVVSSGRFRFGLGGRMDLKS